MYRQQMAMGGLFVWMHECMFIQHREMLIAQDWQLLLAN